MANFRYKAKEGPHKIVSGTIDAENVDMAISKIIKSGLAPIDVVLDDDRGRDKSGAKVRTRQKKIFQKIKSSDVALLTRQMSDLADASVPILRSLQIISNQVQNYKLKEIVDSLLNSVKEGGSFSEALSMHRDVFAPLYVNMVKAGEVGGKLEVALARLAEYLEKDEDTRAKVKTSLAYPIFIFAVGVVTIFVLLTFVIPRLSFMFEDLGQELPLPTVILTNVSWFFARYWWAMIGLGVFAGIYFKRFVRTVKGREWFDAFKLKIPLFGEFIKTVEIGRLARTLETLIASGVAITSALQIVGDVVDNVVLKKEIVEVAQEVKDGADLKGALIKHSTFPDMAINMISIGAETGKLDRGFRKIADLFERQADQTTKKMVSLLGPAVLVVIVSVVGFVVIAMLLPIFKMNLLIQ